MPRPKKAFGTAVDKRNGQRAEFGTVERAAIPPAPEGLHVEVTRAWYRLQESDLVVLVMGADLMPLYRLFDLYNDRVRSAEQFERERLTRGSMGQQVVHPLGKHIAVLDKAILAHEAIFGIGPASRVKLGIALGVLSKREPQTLEELLEVTRGTGYEGRHDEDDPRLSQEDW